MLPAAARGPAPAWETGRGPRAAPGLSSAGGAGRVFFAGYRAVPEAVGAARHHVAAALEGVPAAEEAVFCLGEIMTNAVVHSRSAAPGGHVTVSADLVPGELVVVAVADQGGPWTGRDPDSYPHGLEIVRRMAGMLRVDGDEAGRTVWAAFPWAPA